MALADIDILWTLIAAMLVLLMQVGFLCLESGLTRSKNSINVALKNTVDFGASVLLFWAFGFALMFGAGASGWVGGSHFLPDLSQPAIAALFLFQTMFCATASTIVSGAVAERLRFHLYLAVTALTVALIYPVFGHWAWGGLLGGASGWLAQMGFVDFAGSTVVHGLGGWIALAAVMRVGPRVGRFVNGRAVDIPASNMPMAMLGLMLFVVGWIGFNGGSTLAWDGRAPAIIVNTILAAAAGMMTGFVIAEWLLPPGSARMRVLLNGTLAGLVAITAGCHAVSTFEALLIGVGGAVAMQACDALLIRARIDDAVGAVPVHLAAGIWGTLAVALFGDPRVLATGLDGFAQLQAQLLGIAVCGVWAFGLTYAVLVLVGGRIPLRVSEADERRGLNASEHGAATELSELLTSMEQQADTLALDHRVPEEPHTEVGLIAAQHNRVMAALERSVRQSDTFVRNVRDAIVSYDRTGRIVHANPSAERLFGVSLADLAGTPIAERFANVPTDGALPEELHTVGRVRELLARDASGALIPLEVTVTDSELPSGDARLASFTAHFRDISERKELEQALRRSKEQAELTVTSIADGVVVADADGEVEFMNPAACKLTGWSLDEARGKPLHRVLAVIDASSQQRRYGLVQECLDRADPLVLDRDVLLADRGGQLFAIKLTGSAMRIEGRTRGVVVVFSDVSTERRLQSRLSFQATHDSLTGLVNRREFERQTELAATTADGPDVCHVVMFVDLDQFKVVNDTAGHLAGDELLKRLAVLFRRKVRETDLVARLGGDEFGILLRGCGEERGREVAEKIRDEVAAMRFLWQDSAFPVSVSIGLTEINQFNRTLHELLVQADTACYAAKDAGRNCTRVYSASNEELSRRRGEMHWVSRIHKGIEEDRFVLFAQPIVRIMPAGQGGQSSRTAEPEPLHHEILLRLQDESGKLRAPGSFLPAAERYNLAPSLDRWVVRKVIDRMLRAAQEWGGSQDLPHCAINLSGASLNDAAFLPFLREQLARAGDCARLISFEITETSAVGNLAVASHFIREIQAVGCRFALDDFGSGLSSFNYLRQLPVDFLKIDGGLVRGIADDAVNRSMVEAIHGVARQMGISTIAEYVEDAATLAVLGEIGVDFGQGYGIARPAPLEDWLQGMFESPASPAAASAG